MTTLEPSPVILFDGYCNLCSESVDFVIERDPRAHFLLAALQSDAGKQLLRRHGRSIVGPDTVILIERGRLYEKSTAALRIARRLRGAWPLLYAFILVPRFLRDAVYDGIARNRTRWFGRRETCRLATPDVAARFLGSLVQPPVESGAASPPEPAASC
jgi:predicted DCC family thiol-disulfide oxidoreductase YuxK